MSLPPSEVVPDIHARHLYSDVSLPMWVLYDHPADLPSHYVLRLWEAMTNKPTRFVFLAKTLQEAEAQFNRGGHFVRMEPFTGDDPKIVAVFL